MEVCNLLDGPKWAQLGSNIVHCTSPLSGYCGRSTYFFGADLDFARRTTAKPEKSRRSPERQWPGGCPNQPLRQITSNEMVRHIEAEPGPVDPFSNNAGGDPLTTPIDVWSQQRQINVMAYLSTVGSVLFSSRRVIARWPVHHAARQRAQTNASAHGGRGSGWRS